MPFSHHFFGLGRTSMESPIPALEIVAHRGASFDAPENTLAAVALAWQQQSDAVEIDVRVTKDQKIVAMHDADTQRTCDGSLVVADTTYAEIQKLDACNGKGKKYAGERVPLLAEILATIPPSGQLFVEVKCGDEIINPLVDQLTQHADRQSQVVLIGFNSPLLAKIKIELPRVAALLCAALPDKKSTIWGRRDIENLVTTAKQMNFDGVDLDARAMISRDAVDRLRDEKLRCYFWTVDEPVRARDLARCGVDGVTTNRPGWLKSELERDSPMGDGKSP